MTNSLQTITGTHELHHEAGFLEVQTYFRDGEFITVVRDIATGSNLGRLRAPGMVSMLRNHADCISHAAVVTQLVGPANVSAMLTAVLAMPGMETMA